MAGVLAAGLALGLAPAALAVPSATFELADPPGRPIGLAETVDPGSLVVANTSTAGERIVAFTIVLTEPALPAGLICGNGIDRCYGSAVFPGLLLDPAGGAGDAAGRPLTLDGAVGSLALDGPPEYGRPAGEGFGSMTATFPLDVADRAFDPGERARFSFDVDPSSIRGLAADPPLPAAAVSGAKLHGATVSATFSDGTTLANDLSLTPGSVTGARATLAPGLRGRLPEPGIARGGGARARAVTGIAQQTVVVSADRPGTRGTLVRVEGHRQATEASGAGEADTAVSITEIPFTIGPDGTATVPVTLTNTPAAGPPAPRVTGVNYLTAHLHDGAAAGPVSAPLVLRLDPTVDSEPPRVISVWPADGQEDVPLEPDIEIVFSEEIDFWAAAWPRTLDGGRMLDSEAITLTMRRPDGGTAHWSFVMAMPRPGTLVLNPVRWARGDQEFSHRLLGGTEYTVTITPRVVDLAGNPVAEEMSWSFTTAGGPDPDRPDPDPLPSDPLPIVETWRAEHGSCLASPGAAGRPPAASARASERDTIRLDAAQLLIGQRIAQAALRRAEAVERWLDAGVAGGRPCGDLTGPGEGDAAARAGAHPARAPLARGSRPRAQVTLSAAQLLINQRIAQAALRRVDTLAARLADPTSRPPATKRRETATPVELSVRQLRINQRIAQTAVRRVNALIDRLARA